MNHLSLPGAAFPDKAPRIFTKMGWMRMTKGGLRPDTVTRKGNGPLEVIMSQPSHDNSQILKNILKEDKKILPFGVTQINYQNGFYIIQDDNTEELINIGRIMGTYRLPAHFKQCNVVTDGGILVSDEWFDDILPCQGGHFFIVGRNRKKNLMDIHGNLLLSDDVDAISEFIDGSAMLVNDGEVLRVSQDGSTSHVKTLSLLEDDGDYHILGKGRLTISDSVIDSPGTWEHLRPLLPIQRKSDHKWNIIDEKHRVLLEKWYEKIRPSSGGINFVKSERYWTLIGLDGEQIGEPVLEPLTEFRSGYCVVRTKQGKIGLMDRRGKVTIDGFSSALYCDEQRIHITTPSKELVSCHHYDDSAWYTYLHDVCISNNIPGVFEKDGIWFIPVSDGTVKEICRFSPEELNNSHIG